MSVPISAEELDELKKEIKVEFRSIVDMIITDPSFSYSVEGVEVVERDAAFRTDPEIAFVIQVTTNNRAQLLGQATPFGLDDYKGFYNSFYGGWLTKYIQNHYSIDALYFVTIDSHPTNDHINEFDREISCKKAIEEEIIHPDSELATKMNDYNLNSLVLGGGAVIAGPLPGPIRTIEELFDDYMIDSVLDLFCGSGALSKVALQQGASTVTCLDLNMSTARSNLEPYADSVEFIEGDAFEFTPTRQYDLVLCDPYFNLLPEFIEEQYPLLGEYTDFILTTAGFRGESYWINKIQNKIASQSEDLHVIDTGRTVQLLSHH